VSGSLYDLLGVAPTATADEIRDAWRSGIAQLDPTDRRFGLLNDAAGVLLDADKRAAYDEALRPAQEPVEPVEPAGAAEPAIQPTRREMPVVLPEGLATDALPLYAGRSGGRRTVPGWLLAALAALVMVIGGAAIGLAALVPSSGQLSDATSEAEQTAQRAVTTIFSYDYTRLDDDQRAADAFLTDAYRQKYDDLFGLIKQNAPGLKLKVEAQFVASGIVRTGGDTGGFLSSLFEDRADRVQVLVMFNQVKTSGGSTHEVTFRNYATLSMQKVGGTWLVDQVTGPPIQQ
jgi:Mce-associated membrane protein